MVRIFHGTSKAGICVLTVSAYLAVFGTGGLARHFFVTQDWPVAVLIGVFLLIAGKGVLPAVRPFATRLDLKRVALLCCGLTLALWAGTHLLMHDYPLTRDEHMVVFDMAVFGRGHLAAPLPLVWRPFAEALTPAFLLDLPGQPAWVSAYMPGNAALRLIVSRFIDPALMNPALAAAGAVALFTIARRLFPNDRSAQYASLLLYLTSAQMIVAAMTTYAMTAHLFFNLIWLALFLRGGRTGHGGAILVGFVATGLHQVVFHPLFVLPFLDHLRRHRKWRALTAYLTCYGGIALFWFSYPSLVAYSAGVVTDAPIGSGVVAFISDRILPLLLTGGRETLPLTGYNLVRFLAWQNLALVPLVLVGVRSAWRDHGIARPLYLGIVLTIIAMVILLPYQGHGWGYRYLHGLIGSFALLGAYGWHASAPDRETAKRLLVAGTAGTLGLSLPYLLWRTEDFVRPYAAVDAAIAAVDADFVVIETNEPTFAIDQVRNDPYLVGRPIRLSSRSLDDMQVLALCRKGSIRFFDRREMQVHGLGIGQGPVSPDFVRLRGVIGAHRCDRNGADASPLLNHEAPIPKRGGHAVD
jgi:hypothetical protein